MDHAWIPMDYPWNQWICPHACFFFPYRRVTQGGAVGAGFFSARGVGQGAAAAAAAGLGHAGGLYPPPAFKTEYGISVPWTGCPNSVTAAVAPTSPTDQVQPQYIDASHEQSLRQAEDIPYAFESLPFKVDCPFVILVC